MQSIIAIVGRPNVGKSTLFNALTQSRDALVADQPGLTRDRQYGSCTHDKKSFLIVDTGGIGDEQTQLDDQVTAQVKTAISDADAILFLVDAKAGLTPADELIANQLRMTDKPVFLVTNKAEGQALEMAAADFYALGFTEVLSISALHHHGIHKLLENIASVIPEIESERIDSGIKVAVIGKPNVGKSTLINAILREDRLTVYDEPGTTRDSIFVPFQYRDKQYTLIDTAGVRRRGRITDSIEKFSVMKTLQAVEESNVVLFLISAKENISDQDLKLLGLVLEAGRAVVLVVNKWDAVSEDEQNRVKDELDRRLPFLNFAKWHFISAKERRGVKALFRSIDNAYRSAMISPSTHEVTRILEKAVAQHQPPLVKGRRIKLRYAHMGGKNPPIIVIHGNQVHELPMSYQRYLENTYRDMLKLEGTPIRIELRRSENPYDV